MDRFTGPFAHASEPDFGTVFRADVGRVAIRSEEDVALPARPRSFVDVLRHDGATWVPDGALEWPRVGSTPETDHWLRGDFLRFPAID